MRYFDLLLWRLMRNFHHLVARRPRHVRGGVARGSSAAAARQTGQPQHARGRHVRRRRLDQPRRRQRAPSWTTVSGSRGVSKGHFARFMSVRGQVGAAFWDIDGLSFDGTVRPVFAVGNLVVGWTAGDWRPYVTGGGGVTATSSPRRVWTVRRRRVGGTRAQAWNISSRRKRR